MVIDNTGIVPWAVRKIQEVGYGERCLVGSFSYMYGKIYVRVVMCVAKFAHCKLLFAQQKFAFHLVIDNARSLVQMSD